MRDPAFITKCFVAEPINADGVMGLILVCEFVKCSVVDGVGGPKPLGRTLAVDFGAICEGYVDVECELPPLPAKPLYLTAAASRWNIEVGMTLPEEDELRLPGEVPRNASNTAISFF